MHIRTLTLLALVGVVVPAAPAGDETGTEAAGEKVAEEGVVLEHDLPDDSAEVEIEPDLKLLEGQPSADEPVAIDDRLDTLRVRLDVEERALDRLPRRSRKLLGVLRQLDAELVSLEADIAAANEPQDEALELTLGQMSRLEEIEREVERLGLAIRALDPAAHPSSVSYDNSS